MLNFPWRALGLAAYACTAWLYAAGAAGRYQHYHPDNADGDGAGRLVKSGPPLEQAAGGIATLAQRVRQTSATQRVHGEIVLDYKNDRAIALARQQHVTFAFEDAPGSKKAAGSNGIVGDYVNGATPLGSRQFELRDGSAAKSPTPARLSVFRGCAIRSGRRFRGRRPGL
jgi:hypothetical protein